jgi:four helix bundle protein
MSFVRFQDLDVYRLSEDLADRVWLIVRTWDILARDTVGKQLVRAADSIGANIAEGSGRHSPTDNRRMVRIARGSLHEVLHCLRRAYRRDLLTKDQITELQTVVKHLAPKLNAYLRALDTRSKTKRTPNSQRIYETPNTKH